MTRLNYNVQVGDFLIIHTTKKEAPYIRSCVRSITGYHSQHVFMYPRKLDGSLPLVDWHYVINYNGDVTKMSNDLCAYIYRICDENYIEYERRIYER